MKIWFPTALILLSMALISNPITPENDLRCLHELKQSLADPHNHLNWNFSNKTVGFFCNFVGVECWSLQQTRILSLNLPSMSLTGPIPSALKFCSGAVNLVFSNNSLTGPIPSDLCEWNPYLVTLDLSQNRLTGSIPPQLSDCKFLNTINLSSNSLSGAIPASISSLKRLNHLDLSHNELSGEIPALLASSLAFSAFDHNEGLCGDPVSSRCGSRSHTGLIIIIAAGVAGAGCSFALVYFISRRYFAQKQ